MYRVQSEELSEKVYKKIKEMILNNIIASGDKLNQEQLADRLGVSRTPLLAAFSKLEREMLIKVVPRRGAYVKKLSLKEFIDLFNIREKLEPLGARQAAKKANERQMSELIKCLSNFKTAVQQQDGNRQKITDYYFHMAIMRSSSNEMLFKMISSFNIIIMSNMEGLINDPQTSLDDHQKILAAIQKHDFKSAEQAMYEHISRAKEIFKNRNQIDGED